MPPVRRTPSSRTVPAPAVPLAGDWNGDGVTTIGLYNPATSTFFLRNSNSAGPADITFTYGPAAAGWVPLAGDWDGNGTDTVGLFNPTTSTYFLRNSNSAGVADVVFGYGPPGAATGMATATTPPGSTTRRRVRSS